MYKVYSHLDRIEKKLRIESAYRGSPDARFLADVHARLREIERAVSRGPAPQRSLLDRISDLFSHKTSPKWVDQGTWFSLLQNFSWDDNEVVVLNAAEAAVGEKEDNIAIDVLNNILKVIITKEAQGDDALTNTNARTKAQMNEAVMALLVPGLFVEKKENKRLNILKGILKVIMYDDEKKTVTPAEAAWMMKVMMAFLVPDDKYRKSAEQLGVTVMDKVRGNEERREVFDKLIKERPWKNLCLPHLAFQDSAAEAGCDKDKTAKIRSIIMLSEYTPREVIPAEVQSFQSSNYELVKDAPLLTDSVWITDTNGKNGVAVGINALNIKSFPSMYSIDHAKNARFHDVKYLLLADDWNGKPFKNSVAQPIIRSRPL